MQNLFWFLVPLRPIFAEKMKTDPPKGIWVPKLWCSCRDSALKTVWIYECGRKIRLNFGEDLFFGDHLFLGWKTVCWRSPDFGLKTRLNVRLRPTKTVWFWFNNNENAGHRRLQLSHSFKKAPPPFFQILATRLQEVKIFSERLRVWLR